MKTEHIVHRIKELSGIEQQLQEGSTLLLETVISELSDEEREVISENYDLTLTCLHYTKCLEILHHIALLRKCGVISAKE